MRQLGTLALAGIALVVLSVEGCTTRKANSDSAKAGSSAAATTATTTATNTPAVAAHEVSLQGDFKGPLGIQLWSFHDLARTDPIAMMNTVHRMGLTEVETAGLYGMSAPQFAAALQKAGLHATSMHVDYNELKDHPDSVVATAKALGAKWVGLAWYPHDDKKGFTEADARRAIADFDQFGRALKAGGISFFYHDHGFEPVKSGNGTLLDLMIRETDPALVHYEMDVLWTWLPGVDPVAMIRKYPGRFKLMHIKDMKPGVARGSLSGGLPAEQQAAIGEGQVPWGALMAAAQKDGFEHYYLEDETTDPMTNVPKSISYLEKLKY
ncbi:MAG: sugar phosphate isomerase/epimerase family protein [Gemmatimonadaceae bacterium]